MAMQRIFVRMIIDGGQALAKNPEAIKVIQQSGQKILESGIIQSASAQATKKAIEETIKSAKNPSTAFGTKTATKIIIDQQDPTEGKEVVKIFVAVVAGVAAKAPGIYVGAFIGGVGGSLIPVIGNAMGASVGGAIGGFVSGMIAGKTTDVIIDEIW